MAPGRGYERIAALVPRPVRAVCEQLQAAGHEAVTVGGAVRDALLGRPPGDWDVATSATPEQVMGLFRKTIPTGIKHGTVTVVVGKGSEREAVEVTTYRGEGAYSDGRRPDEVIFGVPLVEDLARRDFVINAIAYDPISGALEDPFGGEADLAARRIRAVGDAVQRFSEDGLRVMRAVRFAAVLQFELDPATEAAIEPTLPILAKVSAERVREELIKLLGARQPSRGLVIARRTGILALVFPELGPELAEEPAPGSQSRQAPGAGGGGGAGAGDAWRRALRRVDAAAGAGESAMVRLAALLLDAAEALPPLKHAQHPARRLKLANAEIEAVGKLLEHGMLWAEDIDETALRGLLGRVGRKHLGDVVALWRAELAARAGDREACARITGLIGRVERILAAGDALVIGELALSGGDVMRILGLPPGRAVGELLARVLERVLAEPSLNTPERLEALLRELSGGDSTS